MRKIIDESVVTRWMNKYINKSYKILPKNELTITELTQCLRRSYFQRTKAQPPSLLNEFLKIIGNNIHYAFEVILEEEGWETEVSVSLPLEGFNIRGRIDAVKDDTILEFKTVNEIPKEPYPSHELQLSAYMLMMNINEGYIIYLSRSNGKIKVFKINPNKTALKIIVERGKKLYESLEKNITPEKEPSQLCNSCEYRLLCFVDL